MGKYPSELKLKIVLEYLEGHSSYPRLCDKYNIPNVSTIFFIFVRINYRICPIIKMCSRGIGLVMTVTNAFSLKDVVTGRS